MPYWMSVLVIIAVLAIILTNFCPTNLNIDFATQTAMEK